MPLQLLQSYEETHSGWGKQRLHGQTKVNGEPQRFNTPPPSPIYRYRHHVDFLSRKWKTSPRLAHPSTSAPPTASRPSWTHRHTSFWKGSCKAAATDSFPRLFRTDATRSCPSTASSTSARRLELFEVCS